mgnify:CR=1 FL=1
MITDNNAGALTLGTGGILTRYDYLVLLMIRVLLILKLLCIGMT